MNVSMCVRDSPGTQKSFHINGLRGGILIPLPESFDINDLSRGVAQILGRIA